MYSTASEDIVTLWLTHAFLRLHAVFAWCLFCNESACKYITALPSVQIKLTVVGPSVGCLPFCTSGLPAFLDLRYLKSSGKLVDMASTQIDEPERECGEAVDTVCGYAESTHQVSRGTPG